MTEHVFELELPGPLDVPASVERFRRWGDDLVDRWDGHWLTRVGHWGGRLAPYACEVLGSVACPRLRVVTANAVDAETAARALQGAFLQAEDESLPLLMAADPLIAGLERRFSGLRPVLEADPFTALVRSISAQQVNLRWARVTRRRLVEAFGQRHMVGGHEVWSLSAERLANASPAELRALQFTNRKAEYIVGLARGIVEGELRLEELASLPDGEVIRRLTAIHGIGRWSADWYLARTLGRPAVAAGDLGVRKAVGLAYLDGRLPSEEETRALTAHWGAAAGVAQQLLLHGLTSSPALSWPNERVAGDAAWPS